MPDRNLVLLDDPHLRSPEDFKAIKARIDRIAPDIEVFIIPNGHLSPVTRRHAARRPSLIFVPESIDTFRPLRGKVYCGQRLPKSGQIAALRKAGIPTPESIEMRPETRIDPSHWGPFTVLKPENAKQGEGVTLVRTRDVRWIDPLSWPPTDPRHGRPMLAQRFIDTGPFASSIRVMTVFGRPVYSLSSTSLEERPPIDPEGTGPLDLPIASNHGRRQLAYNFAEDIIAVGRSVYGAFPDAPVHGVDVIREAATGRLYVVEFNPGGYTWHMSSPYAAKMLRDNQLDLYTQFNAIETIADALIERTRAEAV